MAKFEKARVEEMFPQKKPKGQRTAMRKQYIEYIESLGNGEVGKLVLEPQENVLTIKNRLKAAAKAEGIDIKIKSRKPYVYFARTLDLQKEL